MTLSDLSTNPAPEPELSGLAEAGIYHSERDGFEHGLVVLAMGYPFWLVPAEASYRLLVEPQMLADVRDQFARFERERINWPPSPPVAARRDLDFATPLLWVLVVLLAFRLQTLAPGHWEKIGALDARVMFARGEWWRPLTALFLHADLGHLISNTVFGYLVFVAVLSTFGRMRGWLLLAAAAIAGNAITAALHYPDEYRSLGASTAVFAGIGLLTGRAARAAFGAGGRHGWRGVFVPLASGIVLLGLYGSGGANVDIGAHVAGFAAGAVLALSRRLTAARS
jgi:rhomboid protease GluP